jgi:1-acyl-sn-glycerol-3-phosphate acyltransferase
VIRTGLAALFLFLYAVFIGLPVMLYSLVTRSRQALFRMGQFCGVWTLRVAGVTTRAEGLESIPPGTCLFVANHASNADPPAIVGVIPRRVAILLKKSLLSIPIIGPAFRMGGFVPIDRENPGKALASIRTAAERAKGGLSFLAFPEGTRSPDGRLQPFKHGVFRMAIEAGIPVVPVACAGAHRILPKHALRILPGEMVVRFCPSIDAAAYQPGQRGELAKRVHEAIAAALPPDQRPANPPSEKG